MGEKKSKQKRKNQRQLIYSAPLDGQRVYYQLTLSGARLLGASPKRAAAFGRISVIRRYALQWFLCLEGSCNRIYIPPKDINQGFPSIAARLPQPNFYKAKHKDNRQVLGYAVVDYGSDSRRVATRLATKLNLFEERESFNGLIAKQAFEATILTYRESKKRGIASRLSKHLITEDGIPYFKTTGNRLVPVKTVVVDRMEPLLLDPRKS